MTEPPFTCPKCGPRPRLDLTTCEACGLEFVPRADPQRFCGPGCWPSMEVVPRRRPFTCVRCGDGFMARSRRKYCSARCRSAGGGRHD